MTPAVDRRQDLNIEVPAAVQQLLEVQRQIQIRQMMLRDDKIDVLVDVLVGVYWLVYVVGVDVDFLDEFLMIHGHVEDLWIVFAIFRFIVTNAGCLLTCWMTFVLRLTLLLLLLMMMIRMSKSY